MALQTSSINVRPSEGWVLVATDPSIFIIRNRDNKPFEIAILATPGNPTLSQGVMFSCYTQPDGNVFNLDPAPPGAYYVRALVDGPMGEPTRMGLLFDLGVVFLLTVDSTTITVDTTLVTCDET